MGGFGESVPPGLSDVVVEEVVLGVGVKMLQELSMIDISTSIVMNFSSFVIKKPLSVNFIVKI